MRTGFFAWILFGSCFSRMSLTPCYRFRSSLSFLKFGLAYWFMIAFLAVIEWASGSGLVLIALISSNDARWICLIRFRLGSCMPWFVWSTFKVPSGGEGCLCLSRPHGASGEWHLLVESTIRLGNGLMPTLLSPLMLTQWYFSMLFFPELLLIPIAPRMFDKILV